MSLERVHCEGHQAECTNPPVWRCTECLGTFCEACIDGAEHCPLCQEPL